MNAPDIITFLGLIGCRQIRAASRVVRASCPFESQHPGGQDKHPSFAIKIVEGDESTFKCYTCNNGGDLGRLLILLDRFHPMTKKQADRLYGFVIQNDRPSKASLLAQADPNAPAALRARALAAGWRDQIYLSKGAAAPKKPEPPPPMSESFLEDYFIDPVDDGLKYLIGKKGSGPAGAKYRGYALETVQAWELKWHPVQRRIAMPTRDTRGRLVGISGRTVDPKAHPKYLHSNGFPRDFYLYGEHKAIPGTGILVEGQFDVIGLWQDGFVNAVAAFGSSLTLHQLEKIEYLFDEVVILTDGDEPGRTAAEKWQRQLASRVPARVPEMPKDKDPDDLSKEEKIAILGEPRVVDNRFSLWDRETP